MSFQDKLKELMNSNNIKAVDLAKLTGLSEASISDYLNGKKEPRGKQSISIAKALNVSMDTLWETGFRNISSSQTEYDTTTFRNDMIQKYLSLDDHGKRIVDYTLNEEYNRIQNEKQQKEKVKTVLEKRPKYTILKYDIPASAGTGSWLDDSNAEIIELDSPPPHGAAFILEVRGDSMEPTYYDGDFVYIKPQPTINIGQIGIFYHDGDSYIKELGKGVLLSHNKKYKPIKFHESIHCFGHVIGVCREQSNVSTVYTAARSKNHRPIQATRFSTEEIERIKSAPSAHEDDI